MTRILRDFFSNLIGIRVLSGWRVDECAIFYGTFTIGVKFDDDGDDEEEAYLLKSRISLLSAT